MSYYWFHTGFNNMADHFRLTYHLNESIPICGASKKCRTTEEIIGDYLKIWWKSREKVDNWACRWHIYFVILLTRNKMWNISWISGSWSALQLLSFLRSDRHSDFCIVIVAEIYDIYFKTQLERDTTNVFMLNFD
jgi:hypothetical protein